eukprot:3726791-Pleurochrysis_carterae.AAC.1
MSASLAFTTHANSWCALATRSREWRAAPRSPCGGVVSLTSSSTSTYQLARASSSASALRALATPTFSVPVYLTFFVQPLKIESYGANPGQRFEGTNNL